MRKKFKQLCSGLLSAVITLSAVPLSAIYAEDENNRYPYAFFAGSTAEGAITISADNVCINGNIATNGTMVTSAANFNVNGEIIENAAETMIQCFQRVDDAYFSSSAVETYAENYFLEDTNITVDTPIETDGAIELIGNINISSGLKALNDIRMSGNVENTQNSAIYSRTGDIIIDTENVNLNGIVYAPNGNVNISATNLNINSVVIIADTITISCPNMNANYSALAGELIGKESEGNTEIVPVLDFGLTAYGKYNANTNSVEVYWNTTIPQGTFDIQISDDGENYSSVAEITDEDSYEYVISEPFSQKYIEVIETVDSSISYTAVPFIVRNTDDGYSVEPLDSDEDGLPDIFELKIDTAINNADTDSDGLTDYQELVIVGTDPTKYDSAEEGISDAEFDSDGDGLSNIEEITRNTNPINQDTDIDGLSDYDEIFVYDIDPIVADSDNDGIDDGSEIKLGLDPNSAATHGVPDGEYKMDQAIGADNGILSSINTEESPYSLSIEMKTNGDMEKEISVVNSGYSNVIENDAMIGASLDISVSDFCDPEDIVLKYDIKPEFIENTLDKYSTLSEFQDIKRLNVFKFNEKEGMLLPIETKFNDNGTQLYAEVDELGTYCVMDMEIWLDNLGVEMPENRIKTNALQLKYPSTANITSKENNNNVKLLFMLQAFNSYNAENYAEKFNSEKETIKKLCKYAFEEIDGIVFDIEILTYNNMSGSFLTNSADKKEFDNYDELSQKLDEISYFSNPSPANRVAAYFNAKKYLNKTSQPVFIYSFINGNTYMQMESDNKYIYDWKDSNYPDSAKLKTLQRF